MFGGKYHATQKGTDLWSYSNNRSTSNQSTRNIVVHGTYIENGSAKHTSHFWRDKERWRDWNKRHKCMFIGACIAVITAVVVLCVLLSRKHSSGAVHSPSISSLLPPSQSAMPTTTPPPHSSLATATPPTQSTLPISTPHSTKPTTSSPTPTLPPELRYLHDGAACTADSQCRPPNNCQVASDTNSVNNEVYTTTTCCASTQWGCPGWECKNYNDCLDPWKCAGTGSKKTCCGLGAPYTGPGC